MKNLLISFIRYFFAIFVFLLILPLFLIIVIAIYVSLGKPIFFNQKRAGLNGKPFIIHKFRTMLNIYDKKGHLLSDEERITPFGNFLRKSSLDELPQIINILKGDLNFFGPRPLLLEYNDLYNAEQKKRLLVKPGISGWAQVNGRNSLNWEQKLALDVWYISNQSVWLDLLILIKTLILVIKRKDVNKEGHVTTDKFCGSV